MDVSPIDVQRHLKGASYPCERDDLIAHAEAADAPDEIVEALHELEDRAYEGPDDVMEALGEE